LQASTKSPNQQQSPQTNNQSATNKTIINNQLANYLTIGVRIRKKKANALYVSVLVKASAIDFNEYQL
jgi:hypothetical protein